MLSSIHILVIQSLYSNQFHDYRLATQTAMMVESEADGTADATRRLNVKKQTLDDAYAVPANFLEIDVLNPQTTELPGKKRYTEYEVNMRVRHYLVVISI